MRPLWTQPLHTSASIPLDYASKGYVDGVLAIPEKGNIIMSRNTIFHIELMINLLFVL